MVRVRPLLALVALGAVAAVPVVPTSPAALHGVAGDLVGDRCAPASAAGALVSDRVVTAPVAATAAGVDVAVVVDPLVVPGVPTALLDTPIGLCTVDTFNLTLAPSLGAPAAVASVFASTAAMPWLGDVTVRDLRTSTSAAGQVVRLSTFGGRHNVTSDWTITVDALGVRDATFETVAFGTALELDDLHSLEGVTSRPGHRRSWTRDAAGLLHINATILDDLAASLAEREAAVAHAAEVAGLAPGDVLAGELDGQVIQFSLGYASPTVETPGTGVDYADRLVYVRDGMQRIYDQYVGWGATDVWGGSARTFFGFSTVAPDETGYLNFNSGISAYCLACAFVGDFIEVHMELEFNELLESPAFGYDYPDDNSSTLEVMGHEFTHTVQGGYGNGNVGLGNSFYEATAVMSQSLFHEAENSAQPGSLEYGDDGNGCNGFENGRGSWLEAQAAGPFLDGHTYDACYFWWTFAATDGGEGLVALMEALPQVRGQGEEQIDRHLLQLDLAAQDGDGAMLLARWTAAYTAGSAADGYRITDGSGDVHDWFAPMDDGAQRSRELAPGTSHAVALADGGTAGFTATADGTVAALPEQVEAHVFRIVDGRLVHRGPAVVGTQLAAGDILTVVAYAGGARSGSVALG